MTKHNDAGTERATLASSTTGRWLYYLLFGVQTTGAVILFWHGVPHYQQILADPSGHEARPETLIWSLSAIALIQAGYWVSHRLRPPLPQVRNAFVGYIILFVGRMSFVLATSVFGFVFITRKPEFQIPTFRYVVTIAGLFALFCYTQELEKLGKNLLGKENP
jgi:hypothetical protein